MLKYTLLDAGIAQSVEQLIRNQQVVCSSHITSSKTAPKSFDFGAVFLFENLPYLRVREFCQGGEVHMRLVDALHLVVQILGLAQL